MITKQFTYKALLIAYVGAIGAIVGVCVNPICREIAPELYSWAQTAPNIFVEGGVTGMVIGALIVSPLLFRNTIENRTHVVLYMCRACIFLSIFALLVGVTNAWYTYHQAIVENQKYIDTELWGFRHTLIAGAWVGCEAGVVLFVVLVLINDVKNRYVKRKVDRPSVSHLQKN
jgi:hypothetical protein